MILDMVLTSKPDRATKPLTKNPGRPFHRKYCAACHAAAYKQINARLRGQQDGGFGILNHDL
jgi:hypothetical protein